MRGFLQLVVTVATTATLALPALASGSVPALATGSAPADAFGKSSACAQWGKTSPSKLTNGQARAAILCLVNRKRNNAGLPALDRNKRLQKAAQRHTGKMSGTGCFAHECSGEAALGARLQSVDYLTGGLLQWAFGENIAWGLDSRGRPSDIVKAWMNSAGHRANILSGQFREIGVGFVSGTPIELQCQRRRLHDGFRPARRIRLATGRVADSGR